jgi:hypothetical protein
MYQRPNFYIFFIQKASPFLSLSKSLLFSHCKKTFSHVF